MPSLAALTVALSLFAAPPQFEFAFGPEPSADGSSASEAEPTDDREAAKRAFDRGLEAVNAGEYTAAVSSFERAYRLRPHPVTLFNLALALEKAERLPEAWELFDDVLDVVESDAERREVRRHLRTLANEIAIVEIDARPRGRLCLDGVALPVGETGNYRLAVTPGPHRLVLDDHELELDFLAGDRRVLLLDEADAFLDERRRGPLMSTMVGVTVGGGALALGLGLGAAIVTSDPARTGLAAGAAGSAGIAVITGVVALLIETRRVADPAGEPRAPKHECPGERELGPRLDLELAPMIARPVEFAGNFEVEMPVPDSFPHPRSIAPTRSLAGQTQKRPTMTTPM